MNFALRYGLNFSQSKWMVKFMNSSVISVVLPTFNEKGSILKLVDSIHTTLSSWNHEIVVVDDNSPDGTFLHLVENSSSRRFLKPVLRDGKPSLGGSLGEGFRHASGDIIVFMDSDFNHQPQYLPIIVENLRYYDCVLGSRFLYGGSMNQRVRHLLSWIFNVFVRVITAGKITDNLYGFLGVHRATLNKIDPDKVYWGYGDYCIRLLFYLQRADATILQIPVQNGRRDSGEGNRRFLKTFFQYSIAAIRLAIGERLICSPKSKNAEFVATKSS